MSMNNNYVDARTPEEIANEPKGVITYASSMNNNTLKERKNWEDDFDNLKIKYQTSKGIVLDDITLLDDETTDTIKAFISSKIQQAKEEERQKILAFINSGYKSPASDTGWSIYLDDVEDFINQLSNTK